MSDADGRENRTGLIESLLLLSPSSMRSKGNEGTGDLGGTYFDVRYLETCLTSGTDRTIHARKAGSTGC